LENSMNDGIEANASSRPYDAVVFDLLTALLDSWTLWNAVAGSDEDGLAWRKKYLGLTYESGGYRPYEDIIRDAADAAGIGQDKAEALIARWPELQPWPEVEEVLTELHRRGLKLGIATNSSNALADHAVASAIGPFTAVATAESAGFYKPRPEPYLQVLQKLGTAPARTLFVAGSASDVPGASGVGMPVYWHNRIGLPAVDAVQPIQIERSLRPILDLV
jgi:2-haloalkanoic acid dehalogenase type II